MSSARLSVLGMMRYDSTIFDEIVLPSAPWNKYFTEKGITVEPPDRDTLVAHILRRTANLEIFYPSINMLKSALKVWSVTNAYKWKLLWESMMYEYSPIWNKDAHYEEEEHFTRDLKDAYDEQTDIDTDGTYGEDETVNRTGTVSDNGTNETTTTGSKNSTTTDSISSYNVNGFQERTQSKYTETTNGTDDKVIKNTQTNNLTDETDTAGTYHEDNAGTKTSTNDATGTTDTLRTRREYGNIGVTTTTAMLKEQRELVMFNWYDVVCDSFIAEFCIDVF